LRRFFLRDFIITYSIEDRLYLNITNRCTNNCAFCIRKTEHGVGYNLWLQKEPSAEEVMASLRGLEMDAYSEIIFCGYGEPLLRMDLVIEVAGGIKREYGKIIRINTNGHADLIHGPGNAQKLKGLVDRINISLNAQDSVKYREICRPAFGAGTYQAVLNFSKSCDGIIPDVVLSVVDWPGVDTVKCREIAQGLGMELRVRKSS